MEAIHWIVICPVDMVIHSLSKWGLVFAGTQNWCFYKSGTPVMRNEEMLHFFSVTWIE